MRQRETRVSGFLTPLSVLFSTPESRVGPGPRVEPQDAGLTAVKVGMRARRATAFLERPDRGRHFVLSRWRPAAPWRELGGGADQALDRHPCVARRGRKPREKMKIGQTLRSGSFEFDLHEKKPWLVPQTD